jgi:hypothetical protein
MDKPEMDASLEWLQEQFKGATYSINGTLPGDQFKAILHLAKRAKAYEYSQVDHLEQAGDRDDVQLTGVQMRVLLTLALQAKRAQLPPKPPSGRNSW